MDFPSSQTRRFPFSKLLFLTTAIPLFAYFVVPTFDAISLPDLSKLSTLPLSVAASFAGSDVAHCPIQVEALDSGKNWDPQDDVQYVNMAVKRFQGALRIPTESFDDMDINPSAEPRYRIFSAFHDYLLQAFPLVHSKLSVEKIHEYGLLVTYQGRDAGLKPIVLMAHQDVVPVNSETATLWTYSPYEATRDSDGFVWGRGTTDCKNTLVAIFGAMEQLVSEGFVPTRSIILSSSYDEEIGGQRSAELARTLEHRYGRDGVAFIVDEGISGVFSAFNQTFFAIAVAEKGFVNLKLDVNTPGGHSSVPNGVNTGIGILSKLITTLEENAPLPNLEVGTPLLSFLSCAAEFGTVEWILRLLVRIPLSWDRLGRMLAKKHPLVRAFITTSQSVTLINGGIKINALPEIASASVNYRIDFLSSVNETLTHAAKVLAPIVKSFNLTLDAFGTNPDIRERVVRLTALEGAVEPAPITPTEGPAWSLVAGTGRQVFDNAIVGPSGMIANTDTKWYWNTTSNIFRFIPGRLDLMHNPHTVDERIHIDAHLEAIKFYYKLIQNSATWTAP